MASAWMQPLLRKCIVSFFIFALASIAIANGNGRHEWIRDNAPSTYVVRHGDTLWDIANKFLRDPWRWKEIWHANPEIENPNLIYPGDHIVLSYVDGKPRLCVQKRAGWQRVSKGGVIKLKPHARVLPADRAIPTIPLNVIGPFFNESRVVSAMQAKKCPRIVALDEDHLVVGTGDRIFVHGLPLRSYEQVYAVFRPEKTYRDPSSKAPLGVEGLILGKAQIEIPGKTSRFTILESFAEIKVGDQIISTRKEEFDPYFVPKYPIGRAKGQIISVFGGVNQIGQYQVLAITGGRNQKREVGDVLSIVQTHKDLPLRLNERAKDYKFPPSIVGTCVVFRVFDKVSYVLVMKATRPIYLLDEVRKP